MEKFIIFPYSFFFKQFDYIEIVAKTFCLHINKNVLENKDVFR
jgi:hypothetical protein